MIMESTKDMERDKELVAEEELEAGEPLEPEEHFEPEKRMAESDEEETSHNRNNKLLIEAMKKMMNTELEAFRQEFHQNLRSPRRSQEQHEQIMYQKDAKPRRPQEKPNWRSRSTKDQAKSYYHSRDDQRRVEKATPQHNDVKEVKAVKQSQKESLALAKEQFEDELLKILNAYNKPKKAKSTSQPKMVTDEVVVHKQNKKESLALAKLQFEDELLKIFNAYNKPKKAKCVLLSNSEKAKFALPSKFVKDTCDLSEKLDFMLKNDQPYDKLFLSKPVQPSSTFCFSQVIEEESQEEVQRSLPSIVTNLEQQTIFVPEPILESNEHYQKHCKEVDLVTKKLNVFVLISAQDEKQFGLENVKEFRVSKSVFDKMIPTFDTLTLEKLFKPRCFLFDEFREFNSSLRISLCSKAFELFRIKTENALVKTFYELQESNPFNELCKPTLKDCVFGFSISSIMHLFCPMRAEKGTGALEKNNYIGEVTSRKGTFKVPLHIHDDLRRAEGALNILTIKEKPPDLQQPQSIRKEPKPGTMRKTRELTQAEVVLVHNRLSKAEYNIVIKEKPPDVTPPIKTRGNYLNSQKRMKANLLSLGEGSTILRPIKKSIDREISTHHRSRSRDPRKDYECQLWLQHNEERISKQSNFVVRVGDVKKAVLSKHQVLLLNYKKALMSLTNPTPVLPSEMMYVLQDYEDMFSKDKPIGLPPIHDASQSYISRPGDYIGRSRPEPHESLVTLLHMFPEEPKMDLSSFGSFYTYQWRPRELLDSSRQEELVTNNALIQEEPPDPTPLLLIVKIPSTEHTANLIQVSNSFTRFVSHVTRTVIMSLSHLENIEKELDLFKEYLEPNSCLRTQVEHEHFKDNALIKVETCLLVYSDFMTVITHLLFAKAVDNIVGTKEEPSDLEVLSSNFFVRTGIGDVVIHDKKPIAYFRMIFEVGEQVWVHLKKKRFPAEKKSKLMPRINSPFNIRRRTSDNAYQLDLQGKCNVSSSFNVSNLVPFIADKSDLRSNPFQEGEDDMIMESTKDMERDKELVAEEELEAGEPLEPEEHFEPEKKAKDSIGIRSGVGKMRNRRYVSQKGSLIVYGNEGAKVVKAFRNIPGIDLCHVERLSLLKLAPGGHLGRFVVWTKSAFEKLESVYGSFKKPSEMKKDCEKPRRMSLLAEAEGVKSKKEKLEKKRKPISKEETMKIKAAEKAWYQTMISDSDYTEFDNFTKWLEAQRRTQKEKEFTKDGKQKDSVEQKKDLDEKRLKSDVSIRNRTYPDIPGRTRTYPYMSSGRSSGASNSISSLPGQDEPNLENFFPPNSVEDGSCSVAFNNQIEDKVYESSYTDTSIESDPSECSEEVDGVIVNQDSQSVEIECDEACHVQWMIDEEGQMYAVPLGEYNEDQVEDSLNNMLSQFYVETSSRDEDLGIPEMETIGEYGLGLSASMTALFEVPMIEEDGALGAENEHEAEMGINEAMGVDEAAENEAIMLELELEHAIDQLIAECTQDIPAEPEPMEEGNGGDDGNDSSSDLFESLTPEPADPNPSLSPCTMQPENILWELSVPYNEVFPEVMLNVMENQVVVQQDPQEVMVYSSEAELCPELEMFKGNESSLEESQDRWDPMMLEQELNHDSLMNHLKIDEGQPKDQVADNMEVDGKSKGKRVAGLEGEQGRVKDQRIIAAEPHPLGIGYGVMSKPYMVEYVKCYCCGGVGHVSMYCLYTASNVGEGSSRGAGPSATVATEEKCLNEGMPSFLWSRDSSIGRNDRTAGREPTVPRDKHGPGLACLRLKQPSLEPKFSQLGAKVCTGHLSPPVVTCHRHVVRTICPRMTAAAVRTDVRTRPCMGFDPWL
ncbi:Ribosomal protein L4 domain superfamily [Arabidopsis thaliana x Arabidopsis arenosa]|uniref:Ribosomal protein L4 domain superfamily n=1 Tax=Arabidopsis thaliana x Arabidopsis arenosa TaxID=1240361 RepID=A0A8T2A305_9BRAS|nr:Ribosomal protein L4 domain superfamily [Arabidopsis thaliana x Arabidopsis arenosa]